jgi:hypothetical protein
MNVFISYSKKDIRQAREVMVKLRARGHAVFFDEESLPPGQSYDERILEAVRTCDLFLFLVTSAATRPGSYALTELGYAQRRWPDPAGHVIPVMVEPTPFAQIPPYLTESVTVLQTTGHFATEVLNAVEEHRRATLKSRRNHLARRIGIGLGAAAFMGAIFAVAILLTGRHRPPVAMDDTPATDSGPRQLQNQQPRPLGDASSPSPTIPSVENAAPVIKTNAQERVEPSKKDKDRESRRESGKVNVDKRCDYLCRREGRCREAPKGSLLPCVATSNQQCRESEVCRLHGGCGVDSVHGGCEPTAVSHCRESTSCRSIGRCTLDGHVCIARSDDCRSAEICRSDGKCTANKDGWCVAGSNDDCKQSELCKARGQCFERRSNCVRVDDPRPGESL